MKGIDFLEIIGDIDEKYVAEIEENQENKVIRMAQWNSKKVLSYAASFLLIITLSLSLYQIYMPTSESITQEEDMENMSRDMSRDIEVIEEHLGEAVAEIDESEQVEQFEEIIEEVPAEDELSEEKNIFMKIFDKVVSFFKNLRSI